MRRFELLLLITVLCYLLWLSFGAGLGGTAFAWLPLLFVGVLALQILREGYRWQMLPAYSLTVAAVISYPYCQAHHFRLRLTYLLLVWVLSGILIFATGWLAGVLYPVFAFAPLTGKHPVGTFALALTDSKRVDPYVTGQQTFREIMVQCWYPAETGGRITRYREGRLDDWRTSNLPLVKTRSFVNARPLVTAKLPVILFAGPNNRFQNTFQTEELASHGYVVIALDHPFSSDLVSFPDGRSIRRRKDNIFLEFASDEKYAASVREVEFDLEVRVGDVECVMRHLEGWRDRDPANPLSERIDDTRVGILGHSFGGAVAAEVCRRNPQVRAGINMDGWMFGRARAEGVSQPFFFMIDCTPKPSKAALSSADGKERRSAQRTLEGYEEVEKSLSEHGGFFLQTPGLEHMNYTDAPLFSQVKAKTGAGAIEVRRAHSMVNDLSLAFFNSYLLEEGQHSLTSVAAKFPEATFRSYRKAEDEQSPSTYLESVVTR